MIEPTVSNLDISFISVLGLSDSLSIDLHSMIPSVRVMVILDILKLKISDHRLFWKLKHVVLNLFEVEFLIYFYLISREARI